MKKLFQTKETSAGSVKRCGRVLSLIVALTALAGSVYAQQTYQAYLNNTQQASCWSGGGFSWLPAQTPDGSNNVSWTISAKQYENYIYFSKSGSVDDIINMPSTVTVNDPQGLLNWSNKSECNSKVGVILNFKNAATGITLTYNVSSKAVTVSGEVVTKYSINASGTGCTISPASISVNEGSFATFTMTPNAGYSYASHSVSPEGAATVTKEGNTFRVTPTANCTFNVVCSQKSYNVTTLLTEGSITPTSATVTHGGSQTFTVTLPGDKQEIDKTATNYSGSAEISYSGDAITLSSVESAGTLTVAFSSDVTPIVFWEKYPTLGNNTVNLYGYLAERYCTTVTAAGFYWSKSPITDKAAAIAAIGSGTTEKEYVIPATAFKKPNGTAATLATMENGFSFSAENAALNPSLTEATTIYLVNYLKTDGNMAISDMVALVYEPCFPVESVTLNNSAVSLPEGYKFTFEAIARSAGKSPVYEWYLDGNKIDGATSSIYEFTMDAAASHSLKVKVTGDCSSFEEATARIESCSLPEVTLDATPASATPWTEVIISADVVGSIGTALWSVTPDAELSGEDNVTVYFRAGTPGTYTVKYVGISDECTAADVRVEAEKEITVSADSEDCENPNAN